MQKYNGCGGEGGTSFSKIVRHNLDLFPKYKKEKALLFWVDIEEEVCKPHDDEFYDGGFIIKYIISNTKFAYKFSKKLWWTTCIVQIISFFVLLIGMNLFGVKYFNWHLGNLKKLWQ